jgi:drug/metabolite transporter (DMT)-like permease
MRGVLYALLASVLFGLTTPLSKALLREIDPVLLAGLFYLGSGVGLAITRFIISRVRDEHLAQPKLKKADWKFLAPAILAGGVLAPVLLMSGLTSTPASVASLLLNTEGIFTAVIAWVVFKENYDRRILLGMVAIVVGGILLSIQPSDNSTVSVASLLIIGACLCWGIDNNFTRKVSSADAMQIACLKGLVAGCANTTLAIMTAKQFPPVSEFSTALTVGFLGYGISLVLYVLSLRHIGAARTGAYFAVAPFVGSLVSLAIFSEPVTMQLIGAGIFMGIGLWLHVTEHHSHEHVHEAIEHDHEHVHDEHHQHKHLPGDPVGEPHVHSHRHDRIIHDHPHFPDQYHQHPH